MPNYYANLPAPQFQNALLNFAPVNNALEGVRDQNNANRNALLAQQQMDMRKDETQYQRGRDAKQDAWQQVQRGGQMADAIQRMPDTDPRKAAAWQNYLKTYGDGNHSPEEMDFRTGPAIAAAAAGKWNDPRDDRMKDLELQKTQAEIGKLNREASGVGAKYGKTGAIVQGADGRYYSVQFAEDGTKKIDPLAVGETALTPSRGVGEIDTGTGTQIIDKATGLPVRTVAKDLVGAERDKELGTAIGKAEGAAPSDVQAADNALNIIKSIRDDKNMDWGVGLTSPIGNMIPKTPGYDFQNKVDQAKSGAFLTAIQSMRGLGALSNSEGDTATKAVTRMNTSTSKEAFLSALADYEQIVMLGRNRAGGILAQRRARETQSAAPPAATAPTAPAASRPRAVNPQTGQTIEFDGQQWIEVR